MKSVFHNAVLMSALFMLAIVRAQQAGGNGFDHVEYYDPPNERQAKIRLTGAEAQPLEGGLLLIKQVKLQHLSTNGVVQEIVEAPECVYDWMNKAANSAGFLQMHTGDGRLRISGEGFLWQQDKQLLTISNHVHTVIDGSFGEKTGL